MSENEPNGKNGGAPFPPQLAKVFSALRKGKHISVEDGLEFRDLTQNQDQYAAILNALGYKLVKHHQNFFYLRGGNDLNTKGLRSVSLFLLILFQHLEDTKFDDPARSWEKHLEKRLMRAKRCGRKRTIFCSCFNRHRRRCVKSRMNAAGNWPVMRRRLSLNWLGFNKKRQDSIASVTQRLT